MKNINIKTLKSGRSEEEQKKEYLPIVQTKENEIDSYFQNEKWH